MYTFQTVDHIGRKESYGETENVLLMEKELIAKGWVRHIGEPPPYLAGHIFARLYVLNRPYPYCRRLYGYIRTVDDPKPFNRLPSGPIPTPALSMYEVGLKPETAHCDGCDKDFHYEKSEIRTRDLGAYSGGPPIEGQEFYILCPTCGKEKVVEVPVETA